PRTQLGTQKLAGENYCRLFWESSGTPAVILRLFSVFGPWDDGGSPDAGVVARFAHALARGQSAVVFGDGTQTRDFVYVTSVCLAMMRAMQTADAAGDVINIASGEGVAVGSLYNQMAELSGVLQPPKHAPARPDELRHVRAALGHAMSLLRYAPSV